MMFKYIIFINIQIKDFNKIFTINGKNWDDQAWRITLYNILYLMSY